MAARRFLYIVATLIALVLAAAIAWTLFQDRLLRAAFVPSAKFAPLPGDGAPDYARDAAWLARPGLANDPSRWTPPGMAPASAVRAVTFYVPPTTYLSREAWNAPITDKAADDRLRIIAASQASAFNGVGPVWAPRYRQATLGAFLTQSPDAAKALEFAYRDVERAFAAFLSRVPAGTPIILAGHSQGSLHLLRLIADHVAGTPAARRVVAVYAVGWPVSVEADLPALGMQPCGGPRDTGCLITWQSFAEPADPSQIRALYDASTGLTGRPRRGTPMVCTNPLTGGAPGAAPAAANRGMLQPSADFTTATLAPGIVGARCDAPGILLIGAPPAGYGRFVLGGQNYHVFDYALFWASIRDDAETRTAAFGA